MSGNIVLVVPNLMSIALWSPPLDEIGNTVRGIQFSKASARGRRRRGRGDRVRHPVHS